MAIVSPTDRPKSVRNRCVIGVFGDVCVLSRCFFFGFYTPVFRRDVLWYGDVCPGLRPGLRVSIRPSVKVLRTFSYMLWHIEQKFYMSLSSDEHSIKFECRQFSSIFVGVLPFLGLKILEIHSFPHYSLTCFEILSWHVVYDFVLVYDRSREKEIWLSRMAKAPTPIDKYKTQHDNTKTPPNTSITQWFQKDVGRSVGVTIANWCS